jgi:hypothetical protein
MRQETLALTATQIIINMHLENALQLIAKIPVEMA